MSAPLRARWLGAVPYSEALALQESLFANGTEQHLLLLTHPHVFTYGPNADLSRNLKCDPQEVGADLLAVNRGGDITYHGPGHWWKIKSCKWACRLGCSCVQGRTSRN